MPQEPQKATQDPVKQEMMVKKMEQDMRHKEGLFGVKMTQQLLDTVNKSKDSALQTARDQELHAAELQARAQDTQLKAQMAMADMSSVLQDSQNRQQAQRTADEQTRFNMNLKQAQAQKDGIIIPINDPKVTEQEITQINQQNQDAAVEAKTPQGKLLVERAKQQAEDARKAQQYYADDPTRAARDAMLKELSSAYSRTSATLDAQEKAIDAEAQKLSLRYSPAGGVGAKVGSLLNLLTTPFGLNLGTSLLGGTPDETTVALAKSKVAMDRANLIADMFYKMSPAANAEMRDSLSNYQLDAKAKLQAAGYGSLSKYAADKAAADNILAYDRSLSATIQSKYSRTFGAESPITDAFDAYRQWTNPDGQLTPQQIAAREQQINEILVNWRAKGGTMAALQEDIVAATSLVGQIADAKVTPEPGEQEYAYNARLAQSGVAQSYRDLLIGFLDHAQSVISDVNKDPRLTGVMRTEALTVHPDVVQVLARQLSKTPEKGQENLLNAYMKGRTPDQQKEILQYLLQTTTDATIKNSLKKAYQSFVQPPATVPEKPVPSIKPPRAMYRK